MLKLILKGIIIGIANIIPGVSGGTLAVILGIYDKLTEAIGNFPVVPMKKKIEYGKFLAQIGIGVVIGIVLFAKIIEFSVLNYPKITAGVFTVLILPSIPFIVKGENKKDGKNIIFFILGAIVASIFIYADYMYGDKSAAGDITTVLSMGYMIKLFLCGGIAAGAMIIPGISGSMLLLMLGEYYNVLGFINKFFTGLIHIGSFNSIGDIVSNLAIIELVVFGLGIIIGLVVIAKIINILLEKYRSSTLFFITGIIVVSILQIWMNACK